MSIFSPLKAAYRKELYLLSSLIDSTPIGKRNFLLCYQKAREASLTVENIKASWKATGLWPLTMDKPLISRLLLENSNQALEITLISELGSQWNDLISSLIWSPPKAGRDLRLQVDMMARFGHDDLPTRRQLFRKAIKGFDEKNFALGQANLRI